MNVNSRQRARRSRSEIERLYITMRHLFIRGYYKPNGVSGGALMEGLLELQPEIYGDMADPERLELKGLLYVIDRLPEGIEECRFIQFIAREGFEEGGFNEIIPPSRRRRCYRVDKQRMFIELTRGRSDIYDILTHLTFLYIEANKIRANGTDQKGNVTDDWKQLKTVVDLIDRGEDFDENRAVVYLSSAIGRTVEETRRAIEDFAESKTEVNLYHFVYWLGQVAMDELIQDNFKEIKFSSKLREIIGHHVYGEHWADMIKEVIKKNGWSKRPIHIISANLHSFRNAIYGFAAMEEEPETLVELAYLTMQEQHKDLQETINLYAAKHGLIELEDESGTNLTVQLIDTAQIDFEQLPFPGCNTPTVPPILLVTDYAFGEQAYECMEELLKPYEDWTLNVESISIIGKAGTLTGDKGDILLATAHVFEGTADNYPIENALTSQDFVGKGVDVHEGAMITVLGTSLQNKDVLQHFMTSTWNAIGLEMEGAHFHKAIQSAMKIRKSIRPDVTTRYAYYASDNPLLTGKTLASGSLGVDGVKPTYLITELVLKQIFK